MNDCPEVPDRRVLHDFDDEGDDELAHGPDVHMGHVTVRSVPDADSLTERDRREWRKEMRDRDARRIQIGFAPPEKP